MSINNTPRDRRFLGALLGDALSSEGSIVVPTKAGHGPKPTKLQQNSADVRSSAINHNILAEAGGLPRHVRPTAELLHSVPHIIVTLGLPTKPPAHHVRIGSCGCAVAQ